LEWAKGLIGTNNTTSAAVATDAAGNVYNAGRFDQTTDFDPGSGVFNLTSAGNFDIYVCKLIPSGNLAWAFRLGGPTGDGADVITTDAVGNVYVAGSYTTSIDFDPGPGVTTLTGPGNFISKYDTNGNLIWALPFSINLNYQSMKLDASNNLYATGSFSGTIDFDPGPSVFNMTSAGSSDAFIVKLSSTGSFIWAKRVGGTQSDFGNDLAIDAAGNTYITGSFNLTVDFDPGTGTANLTSAGGNDIFVLCLNTTGDYVWAIRIGGTSAFDVGYSITTDANNRVLVTGRFQGTVDFDPGPSVTNLTSTASEYGFVLVLTNQGNFVWARNNGGVGTTVVTDVSGNVYTTGEYFSPADFDPGSGTFTLTPSGSEDIFVSKLDAAGNFVWAISTQASSNVSVYYPHLAIDLSGNLLVAGVFEDGPVDFDPSSCVAQLTPSPDISTFIIKLSASATCSTIPTITSFTPASGPVGTTVTVDGTNFSTIPTANTVQFNGTTATIIACTATSITVTVPAGTTSGKITVTVAANTATSVTDFIVISNEIEIFNAVSPNNDDKNDFFRIENIELLEPENTVTIYNRWGSKVFEVKNYTEANAFRGLTQNGNELPSGNYYYKIFFKSSGKTKHGFLVLKR
jgi:gliding motility-associated-like protein